MTVRKESRTFGRRDTNVLAWIRVDGRPKLSCYVRNVTPRGAFLELTPPNWLPFKFDLELEPDGTVRGCEIRHTLPTGIGVIFMQVETILDFVATAQASRSDEEEWRGSLRQASNARPEPSDGQAGGHSLVARVRGSAGNKR